MKDIKERYKILEENKFSLIEVIIIVLAFCAISGVITGFIVYKHNDNNLLLDKNSKDIVNTYNKIKDNYYGEVKLDEIADTAINSMMNELNERYSKYLDTDESLKLNDTLNGSYQGIGIGVKMIDGALNIINVYDGTPAAKAGLKENDIILSINGNKVKEDSVIDDLIKDLKESKKTKLEIKRENETFEKVINVEKIDTPVISKKIYNRGDKKIGYIYIATFSSSSSKQFENALKSLESNGIDSLIIDLRNNTGGYLTSAQDILNLFLKKGSVLFALESKKGITKTYDTTEEKRNYDVVVITNQVTASASEMIAAAMKENYGAIIVGTNSFGKGVVQETKSLSDKTMIKYTTASWYTPSGDSIDGIGVKPDIEVHLDKDYLKNPGDETDMQLQKSLQVLEK